MTTRRRSGDRTVESVSLTPVERDFARAQRAALDAAGLDFESRFVDLDAYGRVHLIDAGDSEATPPLLFLHGVMNFGAMFAPLLGRLAEGRLIAIDRPGWGLSEDWYYDGGTHRQTILGVLDGVLAALEIDAVDLVGHSTGGYWAFTYALSRPDRVRRLVALGGIPAVPGTNPPIPLRLFTVPLLARVLTPRGHPTPETAVEQLAIVGEDEAITRYPELIDARVAHDENPRARPVAVSELRSFMTLRGWREAMRLRRAEIRSIEQPTTVIWGEDDLLGAPGDVRDWVESMPDSRFEVLTGGHIPWLGQVEACGELVTETVE